MFVVGVSGVARSGKNLFCELLKLDLFEKGYIGKQFALADELKNDCEEFLRVNCDLNVWTDNTEDKNKFRQFLVWYGDLKRKQTNGRYWINKIEKQMLLSDNDIALISDVRYDFYENDEVDWIQKENNGVLIHVKRKNGNNYILPANSHEEENDIKLISKSDILFDWQTVDDPYSDTKIKDMIKEVSNHIVSKYNRRSILL